MPTPNRFRADRLRQRRNFRRWTQYKLAAKSGVDAAGINRFEKGEREPAAETLCLLADALDCTADYLLGRDCFDGLAEDVVVAREAFEVFARKTALSEKDTVRLRRMISHARAPKTVAEWTSVYELTTPPPSTRRAKRTETPTAQLTPRAHLQAVQRKRKEGL